MALLEVNNLHTFFHTKRGTVKAVNDVSYSVEAGKTLGLVGESGSGKSVSAMSILRLLDANGWIDSGTIMFDGQDLTKISLNEMYKIRGNAISVIFQEPMTSLNPIFTIERQVSEPFMIHQGMNKQEASAKALEMLADVKIPNPEVVLKQYPHQLSGGMRQRVMIAIALSCNPNLLIADEPTTALDVTIQAQIIDLLKELKEKLGMAIIFITHDLGVVSDICDRIIVMYAGKIVEEGTSREIFYQHRHPYTQGLLESVPDIGKDQNERLKPIKGNPPDMSSVKPGCAFAPRCREAMRICVREEPPLMEISEGHCAACWSLLGAVEK